MTLPEFQKKWSIPDKVVADILGVHHTTYRQMKGTSARHRITADHIVRFQKGLPDRLDAIEADLPILHE